MIDISIIIVNYNTALLVKQCVESLLSQRGVSFEIIVIDNDSKDESVSILEKFSTQIKFINAQHNHGFGKANNIAFKESRGRYIFMLNPDAKCLTDLDLSTLVNYMDANPDCGLAGTKIINSRGENEVTAFEFYPRQKQVNEKFSQQFKNLPGKYASVLGASMIVPRAVFEKVKGFDEDFFLYAEETDLCLRIRKLGYTIHYIESVAIQHVGGGSEHAVAREQIVLLKKSGKILFYKKHYPRNDVVKMLKHELLNSRWNYLRLSLLKWVRPLSIRQQNKFLRCKVGQKLAKAHLLNY